MSWPWITLALLGAWHGLNPAMGWLFAVSRGLQERSGRAVWCALPAVALGHGLAIGLALVVFAVARVGLPLGALRVVTGVALIGYGVVQLVRHRHLRWVGMRVGFGGLTWWSFLMATVHGAGLMVLPLFVVGAPAVGAHSHHHPAGLALAGPVDYLAATGLHTAAMLATTGAIALVVYYKVGLAMLRRAWLNVDTLWAVTLVVAGAATLLTG